MLTRALYAGYADIPIHSMLKGSHSCLHLLPEDALSSDNWQSCIGKKWQGSVVVFPVPKAFAEGFKQACVTHLPGLYSC